MARVTVTVCDKCEAQTGLTTYEVRQGAKKRRLDLCERHNKPMIELLALADKAPRATAAKKAPAKKTSAGRPRAKTKVVSMEEIERLKAAK